MEDGGGRAAQQGGPEEGHPLQEEDEGAAEQPTGDAGPGGECRRRQKVNMLHARCAGKCGRILVI